MRSWCQRRRLGGGLLVIVAALILPATAAAHGPVDPAASSYLARISQAPAGVHGQVVDGDQRMWLQVAPARTVVVLDYQGGAYLRFSASGVQVNASSAMYYLNQVPALTPPAGTGPHAAAHWQRLGSGHTYEWHDGRLSDLAATALAPGATYAGRWRIPLQVGGAAAAVVGGLYYRPSPSIVWFWPVLVALGCVLAAMRLRRAELDERVARGLAAVALAAFALAAVGQQLHGRPIVSVGQEITLAVMLVFVVWGARRLVLRRHGWFTFFLIAALSIWEGASQITVLLDGYVLQALPAFLARVAVAACLSSGLALLPLVFAMAERPIRRRGANVAAGGGTAAEGEPMGEGQTEAWQPTV